MVFVAFAWRQQRGGCPHDIAAWTAATGADQQHALQGHVQFEL